MSSFRDLLNDERVNSVVADILGDPVFHERCITKIKSIVEDNSIDQDDIPHILALITTIYNGYETINIDQQDFQNVVKLLIYKLFEELHLIDDLDEETMQIIELALDTSMTLLFTKVDFGSAKSWLRKNVFCCCGSTDDVVDPSQVHEIEKVAVKSKDMKKRKKAKKASAKPADNQV